MSEYNPTMIKLARESRGISQSELCDKISVGQGTISKIENNLLPATDEVIEKISISLNYPKSFFSQTASIYPPSIIYYRRRVTVPKGILYQAEARMNVARINIEKLLENVELKERNMISWDIEEHGSIEKAAMVLREKWRIPKGRIDNLIRIAEDNGIIVIFFDFGTHKIEGLSMYTSNGYPIIFINSDMSPDKQNLILAHEIGHLILHFGKSVSMERDVEKEAFDFGFNLMFPKYDFDISFSGRLDLKTLASLKLYWYVPMDSIIYRSEHTGKITTDQAKYLYRLMNSRGFKKREPLELDPPIHRPTLIKEMLAATRKKLNVTVEELANILCISMEDLSENFSINSTNRVLRIV